MNGAQLRFLIAGIAFGTLAGWGLFRAFDTPPSEMVANGQEVVAPAGPRAPLMGAEGQGGASGDPAAPAMAEVQRLRAQLEADPTNLDALVRMGQMYLMIGETAQAEKYFSRAVEANPTRYDLLRFLGETYLNMRRGDLAIPYLEKARELRPEDSAILKDLGFALKEAGRPRDALQMFASAIESNPADFEALYNAVIIAGIELGQVDAARAYLKQLESSRPDDPQVQALKARFEQEVAAAGDGDDS